MSDTDDFARSIRTRLTHGPDQSWHGEVVPPIFMSTLFASDSFESFQHNQHTGGYFYSRLSNPTQTALEQMLADLDGGEAAKAFSSGMAAVSSAILHFLQQGDHIICQYPIYGGTQALLSSFLPRFGITVDFVDFEHMDQVQQAIRPQTRLIVCESIATFTMDIFDISALVALARQQGIVTVIDNTCATPATFRPLDWGFDVVVYSASKHLNGHSDIIAGAIVSSKSMIDSITGNELAVLGSALGPLDAWLAQRGLRTFCLRIKEQGNNALAIAGMLAKQDRVSAVHHPLLDNHSQYELAKHQFTGPCALLSLRLDGDPRMTAKFVNQLRLFKIGVSWGGFESLVYAPCMSAARPAHSPKEAYVQQLIRLSIGLEDPNELIEDLQNALVSL